MEQLGYKLLGPVDFCTGEKVKPETQSHVLKDHVVLKQNAIFLAVKDAILVKVQGVKKCHLLNGRIPKQMILSIFAGTPHDLWR